MWLQARVRFNWCLATMFRKIAGSYVNRNTNPCAFDLDICVLCPFLLFRIEQCYWWSSELLRALTSFNSSQSNNFFLIKRPKSPYRTHPPLNIRLTCDLYAMLNIRQYFLSILNVGFPFPCCGSILYVC